MDGQPLTHAQKYKTFRIKSDLSFMLEEILQVLDQSSPDYLDPIIRTQIENDHKANLPAIKAMRAARARAAKARDEPPVLANDLGTSAGA